MLSFILKYTFYIYTKCITRLNLFNNISNCIYNISIFQRNGLNKDEIIEKMVLFQKLMDEKEEKEAKILKLNDENNTTAEGEKVIQNEITRSSRLKSKMNMEKDKKRILMKEWVLTNGFIHLVN